MNRAVVRAATAALAGWLRERGPGAARADGTSQAAAAARMAVVIGCDARHRSADFADEARGRADRGRYRRSSAAPTGPDAAAGVRRPASGGRGRHHDHGEPQPGRRQRLQALPRRRRADRAAGRRTDRGGDRRPGPAVADPGRAFGWPAGLPGTATRWRRPTSMPSSPRSRARWLAPRAPAPRRPAPRRASSTRPCTEWPPGWRCGPSSGPASRPRSWSPPRQSPTPVSRPSRSPTPRSRARSTWRSRRPHATAPISCSRTTRTATGSRWRCPTPARPAPGGCSPETRLARSSAPTCWKGRPPSRSPGGGSSSPPWSPPRCSRRSPRPPGPATPRR